MGYNHLTYRHLKIKDLFYKYFQRNLQLTSVPIKDEFSFILLSNFFLFLGGAQIPILYGCHFFLLIFLLSTLLSTLVPTAAVVLIPTSKFGVLKMCNEKIRFDTNRWRRSYSGSFCIRPCWKISLCFCRSSSICLRFSSASFCRRSMARRAFSSLEMNLGLESSSSFARLASMISSSESGVVS